MFHEDDEITIYGTPLPPLEDNENAIKKPELDLTVRDWKGRRRFHGAFTGGFSAGYFNTVDTEKGWIPSQYVSKKGERWDKDLVSRKPEDFMDEEDFSLFGIAPKKVHTKDNFKGPESEAFAGLRDPNASLVDVLRDIIKPTTQSIGVKLFTMMKKGRKYKGAFLKPKTNTKVYGCSMPPQFVAFKDTEENDSDDDSVIRPEMFSLPYIPKSNFHGIGYKPLKSGFLDVEEKSVPLTAVLSGNKRLKISGEAFGYGALEEDDDYADDALVYSKVDLSKYDFEIGSVRKNDPESSTSRSIPSSRKGILDGFVLSVRIEPIHSSRANLPEIPKNWKPNPPFLKAKRSSRWNQKSSSPNESSKSGQITEPRSSLISNQSSSTTKPTNKPIAFNANTRAVLLGEEVDIVVGIKKIPEITSSAIKKEPDDSNNKVVVPEPVKLPARSVSAFFVNRFVQSSELEEEKLKPGLMEAKSISHLKPKTATQDQPSDESQVGKTKRESFQWHPHTLLCKRFNVPHPYPQFPDVVGVLTINRDPSIEMSQEDKKKLTLKHNSKPNIFSSLLIAPTATPSTSAVADTSKRPTSNSVVIEKEIPAALERPPLDLFKAIFASDESETDDDEKEADKEQEKAEKSKQVTPKSGSETKDEPKETPQKAESTNLVAREIVIQPRPVSSKGGIFSGLDLDLINKKISYALPPKSRDNSSDDDCRRDLQKSETVEQDDVTIEDSYGPALPPVDSNTTNSPISKNKRKERKSKKSKSKSRSKHKSKKSKSKHRRRTTEKDSDESDSSYSDDSDEIHAKRYKSSHSKRSR